MVLLVASGVQDVVADVTKRLSKIEARLGHMAH